ncbi:MAG: cobalamin biosynthesis protein CbiX [Rhodobacter sp.]|nr:cobalamin biosynthesis protein CbiX [Rhodobacter sp.]
MTENVALIVAHGQPSDPGPAAAALEALASRVAKLLPGWQVASATLAEPGALARAAAGRAPGVVFPMFMAGGWFTRVQIPAKLAEAGAVGWKVLEPFGCDAGVHDLCVSLVREAGADQVILAAHGSFRSSVPSDIARHVAGRIADEAGVARVATGFIDQSPQLATLADFGPGSVCLPFFAAEGEHVSDDIPQALDEAGFRGRILPPVGLDPRVPALIAAAIARQVPVCAGTCRWAR